MVDLVFKFELTKLTTTLERERGEVQSTTYYAQRINDDLHGRMIPGDLVMAGSPEKLAEEVKKFIGKETHGKEFRLEFVTTPVEDERKRKGGLCSYSPSDLDHDEIVRFHKGWSESNF